MTANDLERMKIPRVPSWCELGASFNLCLEKRISTKQLPKCVLRFKAEATITADDVVANQSESANMKVAIIAAMMNVIEVTIDRSGNTILELAHHSQMTAISPPSENTRLDEKT